MLTFYVHGERPHGCIFIIFVHDECAVHIGRVVYFILRFPPVALEQLILDRGEV